MQRDVTLEAGVACLKRFRVGCYVSWARGVSGAARSRVRTLHYRMS